jgi:hypothetical protein
MTLSDFHPRATQPSQLGLRAPIALFAIVSDVTPLCDEDVSVGFQRGDLQQHLSCWIFRFLQWLLSFGCNTMYSGRSSPVFP